MKDLPGSNEAEDYTDFDTLEERIVKTERDHDKEAWSTVRLEPWQISLAEMISVNLATNKVEVFNRAINSGSEEIRDYIGWDYLQDTYKMKVGLLKLAADIRFDYDLSDSVTSSIIDINVDIDKRLGSKLQDPIGIPLRKSIASELNEGFSDRLGMNKTGIYRLCISIGLCNSTESNRRQEEFVEDMLESMDNSIRDYRDQMESEFFRIISEAYLAGVCVQQELIDVSRDICDRMEGDGEERIRDALDEMEERD